MATQKPIGPHWPRHQTENYYEWQEDEDHKGRFRWRRDPTRFDLFTENPEAPEFWSEWTIGGETYRIYYPAIWNVQRWDSEKGDWGEVSIRMELPGMD